MFVFILPVRTEEGQFRVRDLEDKLLAWPSSKGLITLEELDPWLQPKALKFEVTDWLKVKNAQLSEANATLHAVIIDDVHRKLLRYIKSFDSKRKYAKFEAHVGLAYDSNVSQTNDGEVNPSGSSSIGQDFGLRGNWEGRWLPWGKSALFLSFDMKSYERQIAEPYGYSDFQLGYSHDFNFFRPSFYKYSRFQMEAQYDIADSNGFSPPFFFSFKPSFHLIDGGKASWFKPDALGLELEVRDYKGSFENGLLGNSRDLTGLKLEALWNSQFKCRDTDVQQTFSVCLRNYNSEATEMDYNTISLLYKNQFEVGLFDVIPNAIMSKSSGQEYNLIDRDDFVVGLGLRVERELYKKIIKIILDFDWEDRQSDHSSFDYNHEIFYLGLQCRW